MLQEQQQNPSRNQKDLSDADKKLLKIIDRLVPYFKSVKGSTPFMKQVRNDLFAMIRNSKGLPVSVPTWFVTLSPGDAYWPEIFQAIDPTLTADHLSRMTKTEKLKLVYANPHIVATIFYERFELLKKYLFNGTAQQLGKIQDMYYKFEWQQRGCVHVHILLWSDLGARAEEYIGMLR